MTASEPRPQPAAIVAFWREAGPDRWFRKDPAFDADFRSRFLAAHELAASGALALWADDAEGALALLILLDQFPRNSFRDTPRMYATDDRALTVAARAIARGFDREVDEALRLFFYLPFGHSENLADQDRSVELQSTAGRRCTEARRGASRHRRAVRAISASECDSRTDVYSRGEDVPRERRIRGLSLLPQLSSRIFSSGTGR